ncbi:hypothetical protein [Mycobacterium branderi]|uniref:Uncharacterized protein n=1 Tax=Mycobacterium branderi TaxID=43348 RepID=A0ABM7KVJ4_9MYCO|nr:hypothetical protein [Mycobacterium branderi]MCV7236246.1 hypothetical protein [Mycobacterium branderi]BBZ15125.1 hypothetical protein MBRA_53200 [Mycobacterium branderi]
MRAKNVSTVLDPEAFATTTQFFVDQSLLSADERQQIRRLLDDDFPFADAIRVADSVHVHVKVDDVAALPHNRIHRLGVVPQNANPGYVKYSFPGGLNMIFSSIPVAADDLIAAVVSPAKPFLDHAGIDIRREEHTCRTVFDAIPDRAASVDWRTVTQHGPVHCCHTEVAGKHWVYPPAYLTSWKRPIEIAFGALKVFDAAMGCDLRPLDPAHPLAESSTGCCADSAVPHCGAEAGERR